MVISPLRKLAAPRIARARRLYARRAAAEHQSRPHARFERDRHAARRSRRRDAATAIHLISFNPLLPVERIGAAAIIPPLGNDDTLANRGIAFEYATGGAKMLLSEWPPQNFRIAFAGRDASAAPCKPMAYKPFGVVWTTPKGLVLTLQPDATAARVAREARALIARGCR